MIRSERLAALIAPTKLALMSRQPPSQSIRRWKCVVAYDGTTFAGWQSQPGGNAIQDKIEKRLNEIFSADIRIYASGRTDAGVHAHGQIFHFDAAWSHGSEKLIAALRIGLPAEIQVKSARPVDADFHARFSAKGKIYQYHLCQGHADPFDVLYTWSLGHSVDVVAMQEAARELVGKHDFRAFTALNGPEKEDTVRTLRRLTVTQRGRRLTIAPEADGFLYKMVRSLIGALVSVGRGKLKPSDVGDILRSQKRTSLVKTAPPQGLFLMKVFY